MKNNKFLKVIGAVLIISLASACTTTKLLNVDFEDNYQQGDFPLLNLPGDPIGDRIFWDGPAHDPNSDINPLSVFAPTSITYIARASTPSLLGFIPQLGNFDEGVYTITWKMRISNRFKPLNLRFVSGSNYDDSNLILDLGFWKTRGSVNNPTNTIDYFVWYGTEFDGVPLPRPSNGKIRADQEIPVSLIIDIENKTYLISLPGLSDSGPTEIAYRSTDLNNPPSMWLTFADETPGFGMLTIKDLVIKHSSKDD